MIAYRVWDPMANEWWRGYNGTWIWQRRGDAAREARKNNKYRKMDGDPYLQVRDVQITETGNVSY